MEKGSIILALIFGIPICVVDLIFIYQGITLWEQAFDKGLLIAFILSMIVIIDVCLILGITSILSRYVDDKNLNARS